MEIEFLHQKFTEKDPKLLMDHIQRMASGEAPFFATTLGVVYDKLAEKAFPKRPRVLCDVGRGLKFAFPVDEKQECEYCDNRAVFIKNPTHHSGGYPKCLDHCSWHFQDEGVLFASYDVCDVEGLETWLTEQGISGWGN